MRCLLLISLVFLPFIIQAQNLLQTRADQAFVGGDCLRAVELYEEDLEQRKSPSDLANLLICLKQLRNYERYEYWLVKALEISPYNSDLVFDYGRILQGKGDWKGAELQFRKLIELDSNDPRGAEFADFAAKTPGFLKDSLLIQLENLPINSGQSDFGAIPYKNGLVFCSRRDNSVAGVTYSTKHSGVPLLDIYFSARLENGKEFEKPRYFSPALNSIFHNGPVTFSPDSNVIFFAQSSSARNGSGMQIMVSEWEENDWAKPRELGIAKPGFVYTHPSISSDGEWLYFSSNQPAGFGGMDLYRIRMGAEYQPIGKAQNLGPSINTLENEVYPFIYKDQTLYFSSNGHPGFGGQDIFSSKLINEKWSPAQNLGYSLNSYRDDFSYFVENDGKTGYLASNRLFGGLNDDIFYFHIAKPDFKDCKPQEETYFCVTLSEVNTFGDNASFNFEYEWDLGDGNFAKGLSVDHCYADTGLFEVKLNVLDSASGDMLFNQATYDIHLEYQQQVYISCPDTVSAGRPFHLNGSGTFLKHLKIREWYWDFGDGTSGSAEKLSHVFPKSGKYRVSLGIVGGYGLAQKDSLSCSWKEIVVLDKPGLTFTSRGKSRDPDAKDKGKEFTILANQEIDTQLNLKAQLGTSKTQVALDPKNFKGLEGVEEYEDEGVYRYLYGTHSEFKKAIEELAEVRNLGFADALLLAFKEDSLVQPQVGREAWLPGDKLEFIYLAGKITDEAGNSLGGELVVENIETGREILRKNVTDAEANFAYEFRKGMRIGIFAEREGYYPVSKYLSIEAQAEKMVLEVNLVLFSKEEIQTGGKSVRINNVFFDPGNFELKSGSTLELNRLLQFLLRNPAFKIELSGYTDDVGDEMQNMQLSQKRSARVARYLALNGISPDRITFLGYGERHPLTTNDTEEGRNINRRVEFRIIP